MAIAVVDTIIVFAVFCAHGVVVKYLPTTQNKPHIRVHIHRTVMREISLIPDLTAQCIRYPQMPDA